MKLVGQKYGFFFFALIFNTFLISGCSSSGPNEVATSDSLAEDPVAVVSDPMVQLRTQVDFDITVPVYQSDALQLSLSWGETAANAVWIGDELWSLSLDLPGDTEHLLTITFSDDNGNIELGSFEQVYRTGSNDAETFKLTAEQFDTDQWDTDEDGVSNIDELLLGTDPLIAGDIILVEAVTIPWFHRTAGPAAMYYEPEISSLELPAEANETLWVDDLPFSSETTITDIELNSLGSGTYSRTYIRTRAQDLTYSESSMASRSSQDGSVSWSGTHTFTGSLEFYGAVEHTFETVSTDSGRTVLQHGNGTVFLRRGASASANIASYSYSFFLDLDSIDESNTCSITHGSFYLSFEANNGFEESREFRINRNSADARWYWSDTSDGEATIGNAETVDHRLYCKF